MTLSKRKQVTLTQTDAIYFLQTPEELLNSSPEVKAEMAAMIRRNPSILLNVDSENLHWIIGEVLHKLAEHEAAERETLLQYLARHGRQFIEDPFEYAWQFIMVLLGVILIARFAAYALVVLQGLF